MREIERNEREKRLLVETNKSRCVSAALGKKCSRVWGIIVEAGVFVAAKVAKTKTQRCQQAKSLVEVPKVGEELAGEVCGFALNFAAVAHGAVRASLEDLFHAPVLADAVVDTGEAVLGSQVEEGGELVFDLGPRELLDHAVVHDEELLLLAV